MKAKGTPLNLEVTGNPNPTLARPVHVQEGELTARSCRDTQKRDIYCHTQNLPGQRTPLHLKVTGDQAPCTWWCILHKTKLEEVKLEVVIELSKHNNTVLYPP